MTKANTDTNRSEQWESIEPLPGEFDIGYSSGALCHLIDYMGRVRSEGYHTIRAKKSRSGSSSSIQYIGQRGSVEMDISQIPEQYICTETNCDEQ